MWDTNDYTHSLLHQSKQRDLQKQAQQHRFAKDLAVVQTHKPSHILNGIFVRLQLAQAMIYRLIMQNHDRDFQMTSSVQCCSTQA